MCDGERGEFVVGTTSIEMLVDGDRRIGMTE